MKDEERHNRPYNHGVREAHSVDRKEAREDDEDDVEQLCIWEWKGHVRHFQGITEAKHSIGKLLVHACAVGNIVARNARSGCNVQKMTQRVIPNLGVLPNAWSEHMTPAMTPNRGGPTERASKDGILELRNFIFFWCSTKSQKN